MKSIQPKPYTFDRVIRIIISLISLTFIYLIFNRLSSVLVPFFVAILLAYLINPLVNLFQFKLRFKSRSLSVTAALVVTAAILFLVFNLLVPEFIREMSKMIALTKDHIQNEQLKTQIPTEIVEWIKSAINSSEFQNLLNPQSLSEPAKFAFTQLWKLFSSSINFILGVFGFLIVFVYLIFILNDFEKIANGWSKLIPPKYESQVIEVFDDLSKGMQVYFRSQGLIALIVGILLAIGFKIIGLPMAITLGLFIGALNIVPYLQLLGLAPVLLLSLLKAMETQQSFWQIAMLALIVMTIVQIIQEVILVPKIMGKVYGLHPAIILLSLSIWGSLLGLLGMLIALPLTTLLFSYYKRFVLLNMIGNKKATPLESIDT